MEELLGITHLFPNQLFDNLIAPNRETGSSY